MPYRKKSKSHVPSKQGLRSKQTIDKVVEITSEEESYRPMLTGTRKSVLSSHLNTEFVILLYTLNS